jgi:hypothetical protein
LSRRECDPGLRIYVDSPELGNPIRPPLVDGYLPDLYCESDGGFNPIIGEAKTARDLETRHSASQITAYLLELREHANSTLIIAVPWHAVPTSKAIVRSLKKRVDGEHVSTIFLERLPG